MLSTLGRMIWVPIAFVLSGFGAAIVLFTLGMERITGAVHARGDDDAAWVFTVLEMMRNANMLASGLTVIPAILVIIVGEVGRIRSALYYIIGGGAAFGVLPLLARIGASGTPGGAIPTSVVWPVLATAGFVGGALYWLLAGRRA